MKNVKVKKCTNGSAEYIAELLAAGHKVNIYLGGK